VSVKRRGAIGTTALVKSIALETGRSVQTIWRWKSQGCILDDPESVRQFLEGNTLLQNVNLARGAAKSNGDGRKSQKARSRQLDETPEDLGPLGLRGAAAALSRLESVEERSHARLLQAIEEGDPFRIRRAQEFYLKSSEVLRRLDIAVLTERRQAGEQVPKFLAEGISRQISEWMRKAFEQFLNADAAHLMDISDLGEFKAHCIDRFKGLLHSTVKGSLRANPIPAWAAAKVIEAWNVPTL
jgi:hypothetical protein